MEKGKKKKSMRKQPKFSKKIRGGREKESRKGKCQGTDERKHNGGQKAGGGGPDKGKQWVKGNWRNLREGKSTIRPELEKKY